MIKIFFLHESHAYCQCILAMSFIEIIKQIFFWQPFDNMYVEKRFLETTNFCNHVTHWMCLSQIKRQRKCMLVSKGSSGQTSSFALLMLRSGLLSVFCSSGAASLIWENNPDDIIMMSYESMGRHLKLWNIMPDQGKRVSWHLGSVGAKISTYPLTIMFNVLPVQLCITYLRHWRKEANYSRNHHRFNENEVCTTVLSGFRMFVKALSLLGESLTSVMHFSVLFAWLSKLGMQVLPSGLHQYNNIPWTN